MRYNSLLTVYLPTTTWGPRQGYRESTTKGGWLIGGAYKLYTMFIQKRSHDTSEINYQLMRYIEHKHGKRNRPYVGGYIKLTDDVSRVIVDSEGNLSREFRC